METLMHDDHFLEPNYTPEQDEWSVVRYESEKNFYMLSFVEAKKYNGQIQNDIKYFVDTSKKQVDFIAEPHGTPIVSKKLLDIIQEFEKNIQVLDAPLYGEKTNDPIKGYYIVNYLNLLDCIDKELSRFSSDGDLLMEEVIDESKVPEDIFIVRLQQMPYKELFRRDLAMAIHKVVSPGYSF